MPIYLIDKIKQKNGKDFKLLDAKDVETADGKSVEEKLKEIGEGGGTIETLSGSTEEITPTEVANAMNAGKQILISYTDSTYGKLTFSSFVISEKMNIVLSSVYFSVGFAVFAETLVGSLENGEWFFYFDELALEEDLPKPVIEVDLSQFESSGIITEKFNDASTNTYTFVDNKENNSTTITDSEGNSTVIKGMNVGLAQAEEASF